MSAHGRSHRGARIALLMLIACVGSFAGCKDEGEERLKAARAQYEALIQQGKVPRDPAFDEVREKLRSIPKSSDAYPQAQELLKGLEIRSLPPRPLATPAVPDLDGGVPSGMAAACAELAIQLGRATEAAERDRLTRALQQCREALERERAGTHPHEGHEDHP